MSPARMREAAGRATRTTEAASRTSGARPDTRGLDRVLGNRAFGELVAKPLTSSGRPLGEANRSFFETRFGHDFGDVRVHADHDAVASARALRARAFTVGRHIVLGEAELVGTTRGARHVLAHELSHVVQQRDAAPSDTLAVGEPGDAAEVDAEAASSAALGSARTIATPRVRDSRPTLRRIRFGNDGPLSWQRQDTVRAAASIVDRLVTGAGGLHDFERKWDAFWKGPGQGIDPKPSFARYKAAALGRVINSMDGTSEPEIAKLVNDERADPLERQTAGVTKVGSDVTYLREFAIDQGVDAVVSLLLHESLHGAGLGMGPAMLYEPTFHQFEADSGFPMMMGGAEIRDVQQTPVEDYDITVTVGYELHSIGGDPLPSDIEIQAVDPASGDVVALPGRAGAWNRVREKIPSTVGRARWVWHAHGVGMAPVNLRIVDKSTSTLMASREFTPKPRCVLGVSTEHCDPPR